MFRDALICHVRSAIDLLDSLFGYMPIFVNHIDMAHAMASQSSKLECNGMECGIFVGHITVLFKYF